MSLKSLLKLSGIGGAAYAAVGIGRTQEKSDQELFTANKPSTKENPQKIENLYFMKSMVWPEWYVSETEKKKLQQNEYYIEEAIEEASGKIECRRTEVGAPCMIVAVSVDGHTVMNKGFGYVDLEKRHSAGWTHPVRIGNIGLNITLLVVAKLLEEGKLDTDKKVSEYIPEYDEELKVHELLNQIGNNGDKSKIPTFMKMIENITGQTFEKYMTEQFQVLGLQNTYFDNSEIIYWRAKHYIRDKDNILRNAEKDNKETNINFVSPVLDLVRLGNIILYSHQRRENKVGAKENEETDKTEEDNSLTENEEKNEDVYSSIEKEVKDDCDNNSNQKDEYLPAYLSSSTLSMTGYNLTWKPKQYGFCMEETEYIAMSGNGQGASSILLVIQTGGKDQSDLPKGVVVSILCNLQDVDLEPMAAKIATSFTNLKIETPLKVEEAYSC